LPKEAERIRLGRWAIEWCRVYNARKNWNIADKYDIWINKLYLYILKARLRNWLKLRDMAEKFKRRFTIGGRNQFKEGFEFKKIFKKWGVGTPTDT